MATPSSLLRRKIELVLPAFVRAGDRLIAHPRVRELYPEYLFTSHCVIRASVPLMETARALAAARDDPVSERLAPYLAHHIPEELDHDEWLLGDLELLGVERAAVLARPPSPTVASLVGAQYYWIHHFHPVALLGYIGLLEGYPPSPGLIDELQRRTGFERAAFRTMIAHAELDPGHGAELDELLDTLPLTREQSAVIGLSALHTVERYTQAIEEILDEYEEAA
jgi:pyrroloquinoline quinone (PQQ) biosynthesis protein C